MERLIFLFIDGIGLGEPGDQNPFDVLDLPGFTRLSDGAKWLLDGRASAESRALVDESRLFIPLDATLGVEGLPQSGTGQATLFTGVNCAKVAGRHYGPFPHSTSLDILKNKSLFATVESAAFANAYPDRFFRAARRRNRWSVTTRSCLQAGLHIRTMEDLGRGEALAADLTRSGLAAIVNPRPDVVSERTAAQHLDALSSEYRLTVFEYFHTDKAGHDRDHEEAARRLTSLSDFLEALIERTRLSGSTICLTSDHGNLEDLSVRTHTTNPVPLAVYGPGASAFSACATLADVAPVIRRLLS